MKFRQELDKISHLRPVFMSIGAETSGTFPPINPRNLTAAVNNLTKIASKHKLCLILRDEPAIIDPLFDRMSQPENLFRTKNLLLISPRATACDILNGLRPKIAFMAGGADLVYNDYRFFSRAPEVSTVSLAETGGAAGLTGSWRLAGDRHDTDQFHALCDHDRIMQTLNCVWGSQQRPSP